MATANYIEQKERIETEHGKRIKNVQFDRIFENNDCDFHIHSHLSDGVHTIEDLVEKARQNKLKRIAICDHDMKDGYAIAKEHLRKKEISDISIIPGVEISTKGYHILGLNFNPYDHGLEIMLKINRIYCIERSKKMCERLNDAGFDISFDKVQNLHPKTKRLSKFHIADYLAKFETEKIKSEFSQLGEEVSIQNILKNYLKKGKKGFVEDMNIYPHQAIQSIHYAGGQAILAHPFIDVKGLNEIDMLRDMGLDGIEIQPNYGFEKNKQFYEYAKINGMKITHGSDFHRDEMGKPMLYGGRL
jgi:3',5'-nucleoside bisphosphate phosphatase